MSIESMFDKEVQIIKELPDDSGWNPTTTKEITTSRCRIRNSSSRNAFFAAKDVIIATHRIYLPIDTVINSKDKIKYQDDEYKIISDINKVGNKYIQLDLKVIE